MYSQQEKIIVCSYDDKLIPQKHSIGAVCWDLRIVEDIVIEPGQLIMVGTGIKTFIPHGWYSTIYARSGLAMKMGLMLANSVGIVDADYRGEYKVQLYNFTQNTQKISKYTRVVQISFAPYYHENLSSHTAQYGLGYVPEIEFLFDKKLYKDFEKKFSSIRGSGGFNSTGNI